MNRRPAVLALFVLAIVAAILVAIFAFDDNIGSVNEIGWLGVAVASLSGALLVERLN